MFNSSDIVEYTDFQDIENKIEQYTNQISLINSNIPNYIKHEWKLNEFPYLDLVINIENGIDNLSKYYLKPNKWEEIRIYKENEPNAFSYADINRWLIDLNLIEIALRSTKLKRYSGTFESDNNYRL